MQTGIVATGQWLTELREAMGLSVEDVPHAMLRSGRIERRYIPSSRTIWRVEETGRMPRIHHAFSIATFYGVELNQLWPLPDRLEEKRARKQREAKAKAKAASGRQQVAA